MLLLLLLLAWSDGVFRVAGLFERRVGSLPCPTVAGGGLVTIEKHCHAAIAMTDSGSEDCVLVQKDAAFCLSH